MNDNQVTSTQSNELYVNKDITLGFRTQNKDSKDATKPEWKREPFKVALPVPTIAGIVAACTVGSDKVKELILSTFEGLATNVLRNKVNDLIDNDEPALQADGKVRGKVELAAHMFNPEHFTLDAISLIPKGERGVGIAKEVLDAFCKDYSEVMASPEGTAGLGMPYNADRKAIHEAVIQSRLGKIRTKPDLIKQFQGFLDIWAATSKNVDENAQAYEFLMSRASTMLAAEVIDAL